MTRRPVRIVIIIQLWQPDDGPWPTKRYLHVIIIMCNLYLDTTETRENRQPVVLPIRTYSSIIVLSYLLLDGYEWECIKVRILWQCRRLLCNTRQLPLSAIWNKQSVLQEFDTPYTVWPLFGIELLWKIFYYRVRY